MPKQNLVQTWLSAIGLSPLIVETFDAAGIVHPKDLAELEVCHYPALGVKDAGDRKKLFYLIQRVKMAVPGDENVENNDNDVVQSPSSDWQQAGERTGNDETPAESDAQYSDSFEIDNGEEDNDGIDEALQEQYKPLLHDSSDEENDDDSFHSSFDVFTSEEDVPSPPPSPSHLNLSITASAGAPTPSPQNEREESFLKRRATRLEKLTPPRKSIPKLSKPSKDTPERNGKKSKSAIVRVKKKKSVIPKQKSKGPSRREVLDKLRKSKSRSRDNSPESNGNRSSPSKGLDMEPITVPVEEEDVYEPPKTRRSKRLEEKITRDLPFNKVKSSSITNSIENDGQGSFDSKKSASSRGRGRRSYLDVDFEVKNNTSNSMDEPESFSTNAPRRASLTTNGKTNNKERRSKLQNPTTREAKRLSTIPSDRPSIMSPLQVSTTSLDDIIDDAVSVSSMSSKNSRMNRIRASSSGDRSFKSTSSGKSSAKLSKSNKTKSTSRAKSNPKGRVSTGRNSSPGTGRSSRVSDIEPLESKSFEQPEKKEADTPTSKSSKSSGGVFVHGGKVDKSWSTRVGTIREKNTLQHEEEMKGFENDHDYEGEMRIRVVIRKRPMSRKEAAKKDEVDIIHPLRYGDYGRILVYQPKTRVDLTKEVETLPFAFDNVFAEKSNNCEIYDETIRPLIPGAFEGRWASVFAYGQTGSGKTFTMMGSTLTGIKSKNRNVEHDKNYGLYVLAARDIFEFADLEEYSHISVGASLFEIYGGKLFDLLNDRAPVKCLENHKGRVCFPGLSEHQISSADELMELIEHGSSNRSTGSTSANRDSSRSHAVLQLHLRKSVGKRSNVEHGRLTFIDLAGSERGADTNKASRTTRLEGADINVSLLALKEVIRALATGDSMTHIPFRGSKLTQVLKESFVGKNSRTVMVACVAPNMTNCEHTLNTLRYADRVKERNAETGHLADSVAAASKIQPKLPITARRKIVNNRSSANSETVDDELVGGEDVDQVEDEREEEDDDDDDNWLSDLDNDDHDGYDPYDEGIDELNEVLRSPVAFDDNNFFSEESNTKDKSSSRMTKKEAVAPLVSAHRSIMTEMLGMVKQEMTLVNCTDADRELIDDYLMELEAIQDQQLSMISTLRESLVQYYAQRPPDHDNDSFSDASFDDLRSPQR